MIVKIFKGLLFYGTILYSLFFIMLIVPMIEQNYLWLVIILGIINLILILLNKLFISNKDLDYYSSKIFKR